MTYSTTRRNPYIIGRPIDEPELIFGREALFGFIEDNLRQNVKVILLHGQRRIGKSSVLRNIPNFVAPDSFVFVPFDLQDQSGKSLSNILVALATEILDYLELDEDNIKLPLTTDLETEPYIFSSQFLPQVFKELQDKKLVLLLDEFDSLTTEESKSLVKNIFPYLRNITLPNNLFIILLVGQKPEELPTILEVFKEAPIQEIGLLDEPSAKRLITKLAQGVLEYEPDAIRAILELSAGHPYFTQVICFALFGRARELQNWSINRKDVEGIVNKAIELAEAGLAWFWNGLSIPEQVVFSAVAQTQEKAALDQQDSEEALMLLKSYGVIQTEQLVQALEQLTKDGFLDSTGHKVKVELIRRWLVKRYPLRQVIWQLQNLEEEKVNFLLQEARLLYEQGKTQNALAVYEQILKLNPNHFSTVVALAQGYFEIDEFDKAVKLYTRVYQADPARYKDGLLCALATYGENLLAQQDLTQAKEQFKQILEIDNESPIALEKLQEIILGETESTTRNPQSNFLSAISTTVSNRALARIGNSSQYSHKSYSQLFPIAAIAVATGILSLVGISVYQVSPRYSVDQQKVFDVGCKPDEKKISRGECTFFPKLKNSAREQSIQAFQQGKYFDAAGYFKTATTANRSDPEVLIYYNNARAKQQGNPFTLAVVVPADNTNMAQEILRGVAQAQNQFNEKSGLNSRLLEIAIASDDNKPDTAQKVAEELVKDKAVLAVIGHNTSDATKAALDTYKKANLAIISPTSTSKLLNNKDNGVFFRTVPSDAVIGEKLAVYAKKSLGINNVIIFYNPDSSHSSSLREEFTNKFEEIKGQVVQKIDLTNSQLDIETEVEKSFYRYQTQGAVLFPDAQSTPIAIKVAAIVSKRNARFKNSNKQKLMLLGGDALYSNTTLQKGGNDVEGMVIAIPWFREAPQSKNFAQAAAKQWGGQISWRTAASFDATQALIKALSPDASRSTVIRKLQDVKITASETSGEILQFDSEGQSQTKPVLVKVVGGKFELVKERR
ncbi:ABC transporter substrate-binding protein [Brasilonema sp. UFV-L1]|uniref:ABC transporter substrate-binding protein n=1 Tax=Brasilonema sp. UFV-L1 TaxID=2234130 RepID=UPI00145F5745|nr:ABC transporter substrate-binding protein [Brasilonema sp. UFV-L1]NMG08271.1 branched-chain amino acid ABC transporter substrate-binding protein [Brasilonema sp. UFV-L1]